MDIFTPTRIKRIENAIRIKVINRTTKGATKDYSGERFIKYSIDYAKYKRKTTGTDKVNLTLTGQMLDAFYVEVIPEPYVLEMGDIKLETNKVKINYGIKRNPYRNINIQNKNKGLTTFDIYLFNATGTRTPNRDFLGLAANRWLMPENDLQKLIIDILKRGY